MNTVTISTDEYRKLLKTVIDLSNEKQMLLGCCKSAVKYLSHPDVVSIPFVLSSVTAAGRIQDVIDKVT